MRFIRSIEQCCSPVIQQDLLNNAAVGVTIGNFDGVHLGHQALFRELAEGLSGISQPQNLRPLQVLLTFVPHPQVVLEGVTKESRNRDPRTWSITSLSRKIELASKYGFDYFFVIKFTPSVSCLSPHEFVNRYLVSALHARLVVVGYDWRFGTAGAGNVATLSELGQRLGFKVRAVPKVVLDDRRVSSSLVKDALTSGDLKQLRKLLGRSFEVSGKVRHGHHRGREIGFPTANLKLPRGLLPPDGVYASFVHLEDQTYPAVTNVGVRPTFGEPPERLVETHLIGVENCNMYGQRISVEFVERLRGERTFDSVEKLKAQIFCDVELSKKVLDRYRKYPEDEA